MSAPPRRTLGLCMHKCVIPDAPPALHVGCVDDGFRVVFRGTLPFRLGGSPQAAAGQPADPPEARSSSEAPAAFVENQPLLEALAAARASFGAPVLILLVGPKIKSATRALGLQQGVHVDDSVDIQEFFKYREPIFGSTSLFALNDLARAAGTAVNVRDTDGVTLVPPPASPSDFAAITVRDAALAVALYLQFSGAPPEAMAQLQRRALDQAPEW